MSMPEQKPGRSKQDYQTPVEFITAVKALLNIEEFAMDLAASKENSVSGWGHYSEQDNSLVQGWTSFETWCWLNPPYADITPWVEKAYKESQSGAQIAMLIPASVGANWWAKWVHDKAYVYLLNGRLTFQGCTACYPKDCALLLYAPFLAGGYKVWDWKGKI